jgi:hypothetical protein
MPATRYPLLATLLRRYFYSGWAFLIPYLAAYLLYYITKWPVNPAGGIQNSVSSIQNPWVPPLLHVYWALHTLHLVLAGAALWSWLKDRRAAARLSAAAPYSLLTALAPWALLALIFYIPGVYLEWPSDPWEHLRRINEWRILDTVGAHSSWHKSSYFIPYSFLSWCIGLRQLFWLDFYYTGICLLLCWQYYRLARACGLGEHASMIFVILQALLFGNNIFSFYRYYGISSSIYAQLGAIALTRIFLEWAARGTNLAAALHDTTTIGNEAGAALAPRPPPSLRPSRLSPVNSFFYSLLATRYSLLTLSSCPHFWHLTSILWLLTPVSCLLLLTAFNHTQGIGIAGIGIAAIIVWRLIAWKLSALWWLIGAMIVINALFLWLYPRPEIIETYRTQGWLNIWYGLNILDTTSPAADRMLQILGFWGIISVIAALLLFRRHTIVATLTTASFATLLLPIISIPLSQAISRAGGELNIITYQRLFFACPVGLALAALICTANRRLKIPQRIYTSAIVACLALLVTISPSQTAFNRAWLSIQKVPSDLALNLELTGTPKSRREGQTEAFIIGTVTALAAINATSGAPSSMPFRKVGASPVDTFATLTASLDISGQYQTPLLPAVDAFALTLSTTALLLEHEAAWAVQSDARPEFLPDDLNQTAGGILIRSRPGDSNSVFQRQLVRIDRSQNYQINATVAARGKSGAITYLFVAWYDADGNLLESYLRGPKRAGDPRGWGNGTYSYFGLMGTPAPQERTRYSIKFGAGRYAMIPTSAVYFKVGALLNYSSLPGASVELSDVSLKTIALPPMIAILPRPYYVVTFRSQAGRLSGHWPDTQTAMDSSGQSEFDILLNNSHLTRITCP